MNRFEKRRKAIDEAIREQISEYKAIYKKADDEDRDPTDEERLDIETHLKAIETLKEERESVEANIKTLDHVDDLGKKIGPPLASLDDVHDVRPVRNGEPLDRMVKSIGEQFTESDGFRKAQEAFKSQRSQFTTGMIPIQMKAGTLLSQTAGSGAGLIPVPQVIPGVQETLFQKLTFADLLPSGQTSTNSLRYVVEGTATSGAAGVAEGGSKPASDLGLDVVDEPVKKIATTLIVTDEMIEDVPSVQAYVNGRLSLFIQIEEEDQLIRGGGTNDLVGVLTRSINALGTSGSDNIAETLFKAMTGQRGSSKLEPDWIVLHPDNWQTIRLAKDGAGGTAGQYYGGGPFLGAYGNAGAQTSAGGGQVVGANDYLWGKPVYVTTAIGSGTALVGSRAGAQVYRRGGVSVEATNSGFVNVDLFTNNLVAIRAEERLALCVYRPAAFTKVVF